MTKLRACNSQFCLTQKLSERLHFGKTDFGGPTNPDPQGAQGCARCSPVQPNQVCIQDSPFTQVFMLRGQASFHIEQPDWSDQTRVLTLSPIHFAILPAMGFSVAPIGKSSTCQRIRMAESALLWTCPSSVVVENPGLSIRILPVIFIHSLPLDRQGVLGASVRFPSRIPSQFPFPGLCGPKKCVHHQPSCGP